MVRVELDYFGGCELPSYRLVLVDTRVIARKLTKADAEKIARLLNQEAQSKTPTPVQAKQQAEINRKLDKVTTEAFGMPFGIWCTCPFCLDFVRRAEEKK